MAPQPPGTRAASCTSPPVHDPAQVLHRAPEGLPGQARAALGTASAGAWTQAETVTGCDFPISMGSGFSSGQNSQTDATQWPSFSLFGAALCLRSLECVSVCVDVCPPPVTHSHTYQALPLFLVLEQTGTFASFHS